MTEMNCLITPTGAIPCHLLDMDGVLVRGMEPIEKSADYVKLLSKNKVPFLVFSNNSRFTPKMLASRIRRLGFELDDTQVYTSAVTTADFIYSQNPDATCFPIGEAGLIEALQEKGLRFNEVDPDYVVVGESVDHSFAELTRGVQMVLKGARFVGTNPDMTIPAEGGIIPACGSACAMIEAATGTAAYFVGKPNSFMMRAALAQLDRHPSETIMVGDRIDTDVRAGMELGLKTVLVLTGASSKSSLQQYPYSPDLVVPKLHDLASCFAL